ncbi:MAG: NAD(P)-dependent alcohol dehydrogenase [Caldicoprobacterales bacterium]
MNRCVYLDAQHTFTLVKEEIPEPGKDEVLIKIKANGICGSDITFYSEGRLGNFVVTKPYIPGHEASGVIVKVGSQVRGFSESDHVVIEPGIPCGTCSLCRSGRYNLCSDVVFLSAPPINGTFCDYISVRSDSVHKIPNNLSFEEAAMIEPVAVAVHAVNRANFNMGDTGVVVGAGPIGLLTLQAFKAAGGGRVICVDMVEKRLELAKELGADEVYNVSKENDLKDIADVVFETAGSNKATGTLFNLARVGGSVVQVGWPESNVVPMNIADFIEKELTYLGVNRYANAYPAAIQWVSDGRINVGKIITHRFNLSQIEEAFKFAVEHFKDVVKIVVLND